MLRKKEEEDRTTDKCISVSSFFLLFLFTFSKERGWKASVYKGLGEIRGEEEDCYGIDNEGSRTEG